MTSPEDVFDNLLVGFIEQIAFDVHRENKLGYLGTKVAPNKDIFGNTKSVSSKLICICPVCQRKVGATRFAPHLDKCIQRSSRLRGSKSKYQPEQTTRRTGNLT